MSPGGYVGKVAHWIEMLRLNLSQFICLSCLWFIFYTELTPRLSLPFGSFIVYTISIIPSRQLHVQSYQ